MLSLEVLPGFNTNIEDLTFLMSKVNHCFRTVVSRSAHYSNIIGIIHRLIHRLYIYIYITVEHVIKNVQGYNPRLIHRYEHGWAEQMVIQSSAVCQPIFKSLSLAWISYIFGWYCSANYYWCLSTIWHWSACNK